MKWSHFTIIVLVIVIFGLLGGAYHFNEKHNKTLKDNSDKISRLDSDIEDKDYKIKQLEKELSEERENHKKSITEAIKYSIVKDKFFSSIDLDIGSPKLQEKDTIIFASQIRAALKTINENQYVLIEGSTDNLKFLNDEENKRNINLAFKRIIKNILTLDEKEINNLQFKVNTIDNKRKVEIYIVTYK